MDAKRLFPLATLAGALIASPVFALDCCIVLNEGTNVTSATSPEHVKECRPMTFGDCTTFRQNNTTVKAEYRAKECTALDFCGAKQPDGCCKVVRDGTLLSCTASADSVSCSSFLGSFQREQQQAGGDRYAYNANYVGGESCADLPECAAASADPRTPTAPPPTTDAPEIREVTPAVPVLGVPIPGIPSFEAPGGSYGAGYAIPWIAQYISGLYTWVLASVITLAIAMTVWGGAKWITAGGDTSRVSSAKTTIVNAVTGLLLALGTYLLLWTLNPAILQFKALQISTVQQILVRPDPANENTMSSDGTEQARADSQGAASGAGASSDPTAPAPTGPEGTTPAFKQGGSGWGADIYGDPEDPECKRQMSCSPGAPCTVTCSGAQISLTNPPQYAWAGCGPTSAAMVANFFGKQVTPEYIGTWQGKTKKRICGCGGTPDVNGLFPDLKIRAANGQEALTVLENGTPVIFSTGPYKALGGCFNSGQHFMVAAGVSGEWVEINDPSTCGRKEGTGTNPDQIVVAKNAPYGITRLKREQFLKGAAFFIMEKK